MSSHTLPIGMLGFLPNVAEPRLLYAEARSRQLPPVQVSETELAALREFARAHGLSLADLTRSALAQFTGLDCGPRLNRARPRSWRKGAKVGSR